MYSLTNPAPGCIVTQDFDAHKRRAIDRGCCYQPGKNCQCSYYPGYDLAPIGGGNPEVLAVARQKITVASMDKATIANPESGYGNQVRGEFDNGAIFIYAHLDSFLVKVGDIVEPGQPVGIMGSTGNSSGTHLHGELRERGIPIDWWPYVEAQAPVIQPPIAGDEYPLVSDKWRVIREVRYRSEPNGVILGLLSTDKTIKVSKGRRIGELSVWLKHDLGWTAFYHDGQIYLEPIP